MKKAVKSFITMLLVVSLLMSNFAMIFSSAASNAEYSVELAFNNIFVFEKWAGNPFSSAIPLKAADGSAIGTVTTDMTNGTVVINNNGKSSTNEVYTGFSMSENTADNQPYYRMEVEPNTTYTFSYTTTGLNSSLQPYIFMFDSDYKYLSLAQHSVTGNKTHELSFTTSADTRYIQMRFTLANASGSSSSVTISNIVIRKADSDINTAHRKTYTYSGSTTNYYGELPVPTAPEGYVFAGWYTGENGEGRRISASTPVSYESLTVYAKFEPAASALTIKQLPAKTVYTAGERVNLTGLVLEATVNGTKTEITSGFSSSPEVLTSTGTQTVTVSYGGKAVTFTVNVSASASRTVVINGATANASITNNVYTLNYTGNAFNRYSVTYYSDAYVQGIITYTDGATEEFFLEPSSNFDNSLGTFTSFIDGYLDKILSAFHQIKEVTTGTRSGIRSISFKPLDNANGTFELFSISTEKAAVDTSKTTAYFKNEEYEMGIDLLNGGVVSELYDLDSDIVARVYNENGNNVTKVDYASKLAGGHISENTRVNLINRYDTGRYLQQSYYGTYDRPYQQGFYGNVPWNYNPVQGGNIVGEASKVIDYEINTEENYIYVKSRPLDWAKWSDRFANGNTSDTYSDLYGEDYKTDTYVEAKYVFEEGIIKTYCRMVDYSGYPSATTTQEMPAFYTIEPLNDFVYNNVSADKAWKEKNLTYKSEPDFWGVSPEYNQGHGTVDPDVDSSEHWAAFMASTSADSFGVGVYSPEITDFHYGVYPQIYTANTGTATNYRHAQTTTPDKEDSCALIAPVGVRTFESYSPAEYAFYISTGTVNQIRNSFGVIDDKEFAAELNKGMVVVPETVYMTPSTGASTTGQYYVNNVLDMEAKAATTEVKNNNTNGYVQLFVPGAESVTYTVNYCAGTNVGDVKASGEGTAHKFNSDGYLALNTTTISVTTGLTATQTATAEWVFTVKMKDGLTRTYYAYTTLYAPFYQPVGVAAGVVTYGSNNSNRIWVQNLLYFEGVHNFSNYTATNSGYVSNAYPRMIETSTGDIKNMVTMLYGFGHPDGDGDDLDDKWITKSSSANNKAPQASIRYAMANKGTDKEKPSHLAISEVGHTALLTVDTSRYSNLNQIPNLKIGYDFIDATRCTETYWYLCDYTDINDSYVVSQYSSDSSTHDTKWWYSTGPYINGTYHNSNYGNASSIVNKSMFYYDVYNKEINPESDVYTVKGTARGYAKPGSTKKNPMVFSYIQLSVSNVNKETLRERVVQGSSLIPENYTEDSWKNYYTQLKAAAQKLGNPTSTDVSTSALQDAYNDLQPREFKVTFDNVIDFSQWKTSSVEYGTIPELTTATGSLTLTSNSGVSKATTTSPTFPVTANESYTVDINITGNNWDVYVFFYNGSTETGHALVSSSSGTGSFDSETGLPYFTVPEGVTNAVICLDANGSGNTVTFNNIKVYLKYKTPHIMGSSYEAPVTVKATQAYQALLPTPTREGYIFEGWYIEKDGFVSESHDAYYYGKNMVFYSSWKGINYTVKFDGNGFAYSDTYAAEYATKITLPDTDAYEGYELLGWSTDKNATAPMYIPGQTVSGLTTTNGDYITLYAVWAESSYTVTFNANGGTGTSSATVKFTQTVTLPTDSSVTREGYTLLGWSTEADATSASYTPGQTVSGLTATNGDSFTFYAVWEKNISIVDDTIVIDFGLPVDINVLENDTVAENGSITGIKTADGNITTGKLELTYGTAALNGQSIIYTPASTNMRAEDVFFYVYEADGKEFIAKVTVVPATSIYYEESFMEFTNKGNYVWVDVKDSENTEIKNIFQSDDRPGEDSAYGSDAAYNDSIKYSLGTAKKTTVDSKSVGSEPEATFTFSGTGFDLYSVTSNETGAIRVQIFKAGSRAKEDKIKDYLVNTYYGYTGTGDGLTPDADSTAALYQVPVISTSELDYGTYDVVIKPIYTYIFDPDYKTDDGYSIYVDSVRIFNPAGLAPDPDSTIGDIYLADGEYKPTYQTVRSVLLSSVQLEDVIVTGKNGALYLDGTTQNIETYAKQGPKNEVYLAKGQAIAFMLSASDIASLATLNLGAKVIDGGTGTISVAHGTNSLVNISINGATEQFYGLNTAVSWLDAATGKTTYPVIITNTSDAVVSLTSFKWGHKATEASAVSFMVYPDTAMLAMRAMSSIMESAEITEESVTVEWGNDSFITGETATLYVTTPESVMSVWVDGVDMEEIIAENGTKLWSCEIVPENAGETTFTIDFLTDFIDPVLTLTETILVEAAPVEEETTEEETTETIIPDEEVTEDTESDGESNEEDSSIAGSIKNMIDLIFRFFRSIIEFLRGLAK